MKKTLILIIGIIILILTIFAVIRGVKIEIHVATTYEPPEDNTDTETN